jgi:hypothetical protein
MSVFSFVHDLTGVAIFSVDDIVGSCTHDLAVADFNRRLDNRELNDLLVRQVNLACGKIKNDASPNAHAMDNYSTIGNNIASMLHPFYFHSCPPW